MEAQSTHPSLLVRLRDTTDQAAWREFDARYGALVLAYCRSRGLHLCDAEDVRQLVMLNLARALPGFEYQPVRGRFRSYLGRVVRNAVVRHHDRHTGAEMALDTDGLAQALSGDLGAADAVWEQEWTSHHCRMALRTLRETHDANSVEVFDRLLGGASIGEVAGQMSMTPEAVRKIKQRVRDALREIVGRQIREEDADA